MSHRALRAPNRIELVRAPIFGISWYTDISDGTSIVACCGGGGQAKTGVTNSILVYHNNTPPIVIPAADAGLCVTIYVNPITRIIWLIVGLGTVVQRYEMEEILQFASTSSMDPKSIMDELEVSACDDETKPRDLVNSVAVNGMANKLAVGCEFGNIHVYEIDDEEELSDSPALFTFTNQHTRAVVSVKFSMHNDRLISGARDGYCCVWDVNAAHAAADAPSMQQKQLLAALQPVQAKKAVTVRGCAFVDLQGNDIIILAGTKRFESYLTRWSYNAQQQSYDCTKRTVWSKDPGSALDLSMDGKTLALSNCESMVVLWDMEKWKPIKTFYNVHGLPITCLAVRPYSSNNGQLLQDEIYTDVPVHVRTGSAESQLALLTMQKHVPKQQTQGNSGGGILNLTSTLLRISIAIWLLLPIMQRTNQKCLNPSTNKYSTTTTTKSLFTLPQCILRDVLYTKKSTTNYPNIDTPPL